MMGIYGGIYCGQWTVPGCQVFVVLKDLLTQLVDQLVEAQVHLEISEPGIN